jgi:putative oxidoreductase
MLQYVCSTSDDYLYLILRVVAGIVILPYGMQKLLGWFPPLGGGVGVKHSLALLRQRNIPIPIGWMVILGQSLGSVALILGFLTRVAAFGNMVIFLAALFVHLKDGWSMNWTGKKKGEGVEYFVLLLSILMVLLIRGGGLWSIDGWLYGI